MSASEVLKGYRSQGYGEKPTKSVGADDSTNDPNEPHTTSRIVKLSDDEVKGLEQYAIKPGEEVILEMSGNLESDGHFHVMTVKYAEGKGKESGMADEQGMAQQVAQLVRPQIQPSPS